MLVKGATGIQWEEFVVTTTRCPWWPPSHSHTYWSGCLNRYGTQIVVESISIARWVRFRLMNIKPLFTTTCMLAPTLRGSVCCVQPMHHWISVVRHRPSSETIIAVFTILQIFQWSATILPVILSTGRTVHSARQTLGEYQSFQSSLALVGPWEQQLGTM